ncbi:hypothetical protein ES703_83539 [subsurface metagenome]
MTMPGFITGQPISGQQAGNGILQFLPCFPGEGPPFMPRVLARAMFPGGFVPGRLPAAQPPPLVQPPVPVKPPVPAANQVVTRPPVAARQPAAPSPQPPAPRGYRPISSGGEPIGSARSERIRIRERPGL